MWVHLAVFVCWLVLGGQGQDRASFRRSGDRNGRCQYTFTVDSPVESSCRSSIGGPEAENLSARLTLLEAVVSRVLGAEGLTEAAREAADVQETRRLVQDKEQLDRQVQELRRRVEELTMETEKLREKPCPLVQADPTDGFGVMKGSGPVTNGEFQELKAELSELPAPAKVRENVQNNTGCGELVSVGEPETHQKAESITGKYGMWFQDPVATGRPYGPNTVWRINAVGKDVKELYAYENLEQLARGFPMKVVVLPEPVESTGATVYRGYLYYQQRRSPTLLRFDLASEKIVARKDLPQAGFHGKYPYSWGGYTDIDLAVDEQGLWAIYSTDKAGGAIVLSQLDPESLEVIRSWKTNVRKNKVANAFMICGRLYTVASYSTNTTTVNYTFDTASGKSKMLDVPFHNRYRYNSMIDYNYAKKKLFAWDNFHMVTYEVKLGGF
ncbi:myocilin-like isoform X2 [Colossoma macropomum]|uniref:myocilin-like isoform X2 n=1 Tax=Colossoma macropomum TaxID=42526 RepID=UPI001863DA14|nr:myocilin-like isoform X2 [Colossoma macropomum]